MCCHIFENAASGIICGCNHFIFSNGINLIRIIVRIILIYCVLYIIRNSVVLVLIDLILTCLIIIIYLVYINKKLNLKIKLYYWDKLIFIESFKYTILLFVQSVVVQINGNVDNVVVGAVIGPVAVGIYSMGLLVFGMFQQLSTAISTALQEVITGGKAPEAAAKDAQAKIDKIGK
jgi:O-antigen/teichoic acid export membrane protein